MQQRSAGEPYRTLVEQSAHDFDLVVRARVHNGRLFGVVDGGAMQQKQLHEWDAVAGFGLVASQAKRSLVASIAAVDIEPLVREEKLLGLLIISGPSNLPPHRRDGRSTL